MSLFSKPSKDADSDPLSGLTAEEPRPAKKKKPSNRKIGKNKIIRAEELEKLLEEGEEIDPEAVISMYRPRRKGRMFGAALLRLDRLRLLALALVLLVAFLFILSFMQEKMGNFTINLDRIEMFRKGISISEDEAFTNPTARLVADVVNEATNIADSDIPTDLDTSQDGTHNGDNYMAYTYYVRNGGKIDVSYVATIRLDSYSKGAEEAVRVVVWRNGVKTVYAEPAANGEPEPGCVNFVSHDVVCQYTEENFFVGRKDKYTICIYLDGDDPECLDNIVGGGVQFSMYIDADGKDDRPLWQQYLQDLLDSITGNSPINAAGNEAPDWVYTQQGGGTVTDEIDEIAQGYVDVVTEETTVSSNDVK